MVLRSWSRGRCVFTCIYMASTSTLRYSTIISPSFLPYSSVESKQCSLVSWIALYRGILTFKFHHGQLYVQLEPPENQEDEMGLPTLLELHAPDANSSNSSVRFMRRGRSVNIDKCMERPYGQGQWNYWSRLDRQELMGSGGPEFIFQRVQIRRSSETVVLCGMLDRNRWDRSIRSHRTRNVDMDRR